MANYVLDKYIQHPKIDPLSVETNAFLHEFSDPIAANLPELNQMENLCESMGVVLHERIELLEKGIASYDHAIQELTKRRKELEEYRGRFTGMYELLKRRG